MPIHVVLLRAVNVAGHRPVAMADLRDAVTQLGFTGVHALAAAGLVRPRRP